VKGVAEWVGGRKPPILNGRKTCEEKLKAKIFFLIAVE